MLWAILNKFWRQHPTIQQLYGHLLPITKTIQVRWTRHVGHCWRSKDKLISDILLWTPSHGWAKAGWPARTYIQQLSADTECSLEDLPGTMDDRDGWQERVREICADRGTWWWWVPSLDIFFSTKHLIYQFLSLIYLIYIFRMSWIIQTELQKKKKKIKNNIWLFLSNFLIYCSNLAHWPSG